MLLISRTPAIPGLEPVDAQSLADHLRIDIAEAFNVMPYAQAAAREIEDYCGLALFTQEIVALAEACPGRVLQLPVGPVAPGTTPTLELIGSDGIATPLAEGWVLNPGRYPALAFTDAPGGRLRVTYQAGFGADDRALPRDLYHAILDQTLRLYDRRGDEDMPVSLAASTARICARYRRVVVAA